MQTWQEYIPVAISTGIQDGGWEFGTSCFLVGVQVLGGKPVVVKDAEGKVIFRGNESKQWSFPVYCKGGLVVTSQGRPNGYIIEYIQA